MKKLLGCIATAIGALRGGCRKDTATPINAAQLVGYWHCTQQTGEENGKTWSDHYTDSDTIYIHLRSDATGEMDGQSLLELSGYYTFTWALAGETIHTVITQGQNLPFPETWHIISISDNELELYWNDGLNITARFRKTAK